MIGVISSKSLQQFRILNYDYESQAKKEKCTLRFTPNKKHQNTNFETGMCKVAKLAALIIYGGIHAFRAMSFDIYLIMQTSGKSIQI